MPVKYLLWPNARSIRGASFSRSKWVSQSVWHSQSQLGMCSSQQKSMHVCINQTRCRFCTALHCRIMQSAKLFKMQNYARCKIATVAPENAWKSKSEWGWGWWWFTWPVPKRGSVTQRMRGGKQQGWEGGWEAVTWEEHLWNCKHCPHSSSPPKKIVIGHIWLDKHREVQPWHRGKQPQRLSIERPRPSHPSVELDNGRNFLTLLWGWLP